MTEKNLPSIEYLHKRLRYDPNSGKLFWTSCEDMPKNWNRRYAEKEAFTSQVNGYRNGKILGATILAHRVIWTMHYGKWPLGYIDHINGEKSDNRICNLRDVTHQENHRNMPIRSDNTSGVTGVHWNKVHKKWQARIKIGGRYKHIGFFAYFSDAANARSQSSRQHGFTDRHGT